MSRTTARIIGACLGLAIAGYVWVYVPMKRNHDECGKVTVCQRPQGKNHDR